MPELKDQLQQTLGSGYRVIKELGGGGMSRVFAAEETELERPVVIKVLPPDLGAGLNVERFRREIQLAAKLQHPHIVPLLSAGAKDGLLYYTMPHIDGDTLRVKLSRSGEMPVPDAIRVMRDVADALEYAHEHGVVHRDIKPENVLLSGHHGLVTDFGVSKALANSTGQQSLTSMGVALGTPTYMSPEQATADPNVDHRTDIYALGVLGYELLAGRPPFSGNTPQQVLAAQVTEIPADIRKHRPNIPSQLAALIMRCLEKKPADRFQSAHEVRLQLESLGTPSGGTQPYQAVAVPGSTMVRFRNAFKTNPLMASTSAAVGVAMLLGILEVLATGIRSLGGGGEVPFTAGTARQITNNPGIEITPALSPDGKLIAYAGGSPFVTRIYVRQVAGGEPVEVAPNLPGNQRGPQWSADGSQLVFAGGAGILAVPALGGVPRLLVLGRANSPTWSHDGKSLAFARGPSLVLADADGRNERKLRDCADEPHSIAWSPDDSRLAYVCGNTQFTYSRVSFANISPAAIWTIGRDGRDGHEVVRALYLNVTPVWTADGRGLLYVSNEHGGRDVYHQRLSRNGAADGVAARLTTGLNIHGISLSSDGSRLAYSAMTANVGIWAIPIPSQTMSVGAAHAISQSNERIETPRVSPDGKWIAFDSDRSGRSHIYRIPVAGGPVEQITSGNGDEFNAHWSPDGTQSAYHLWTDGQRDSYVTPVAGFSPRLVMGGPSHDYAGEWSPDGKQLAVPSNRTGPIELYVVSLSGGQPRRITTTSTGNLAAWSPDGRWLAAASKGAIVLISPVTGETRTVVPKPLPDSAALVGNVEWSADSRQLYFEIADQRGNENIGVMDIDGSNPRLLVRFDRPDMPAYRLGFSTDHHNFYFPIGKHEADIWVMDLQRK